MPKNRWGGAAGPTTRPEGRVKRAAKSARDWADDRTGRKASTAWRAARGERGFRARSRAARHAVRQSGGGRVISGLVGALAAIFAGFSALFGPRTVRSAKADAEAAAQEQAAQAAQDQATDASPGPAGAAGQPAAAQPAGHTPNAQKQTTTAATAAPTTGGTTMAGLPAAQIAHDMASSMSRYEPVDAWQVVAESRQWTDVPMQVAMSVKAYADRLDGARFPLNPAVVEKLREFFQAIAATRSIAEEIEPLLRRAHEDDIARRESPRGDETKWNI
jgi:hypothetical protein